MPPYGLQVTLLSSLAVFVSAAWMTGRVRRYALAHRILDVPNARSSHVEVTPRGGGVAIVSTVVAALVVLAFAGALPWPLVGGLAGGGTLVAVVGFVDDHGHVPVGWRLLGHFAAAACVIVGLGGLPPLSLFGSVVDLGWSGDVLALIYLVWLLNLTNFMDGIDGIAALESSTVSLGGVLIFALARADWAAGLIPLLLAAGTLGFLIWNWPPAKIFMGDVGSGFVGLMLGAMSLQAGWVAPALFWSWVIMQGVFIVDTTVTLTRRITRGDRFYEAHRSHAYQHASQRMGSHRSVTLVVGAINLIWLLPIACLVALDRVDGMLGVGLGYAPLLALAIHFGAGARETPVAAGRLP